MPRHTVSMFSHMASSSDMLLTSISDPPFRITSPSSSLLVQLLQWLHLCISRCLIRYSCKYFYTPPACDADHEHACLCQQFAQTISMYHYEAYAKLVPRANIQKSLTAECVPRAPRRLDVRVSCSQACVGWTCLRYKLL